LKQLPLDLLKIDGSFTKDVTRNADDAAIVSGIIALAHSLRLEVVAEGVETIEQAKFLEEQRCDIIQGYLLSEPLTAPEFEKRFLLPGSTRPANLKLVS
jgi:EAL domain-containing protein (putative c-di-GMP-specific phosphodiesterase class I)